MPINKKQHYRGSSFNDRELKDAKSLQLNQDAISPDEAVRKSQSETIAEDAAQEILIALSNLASNNTAFTSASIVGMLAAKQDNVEIDPSSTALLQMVDGNKIKATNLLITSTEVDEIFPDLASYLNGIAPTKEEGDIIILNAATDNQQRSWIKTSSASQGVEGYARLQTDYNVISIRSMLSSAQFMTYEPTSGQFGLDLGNSSGKLGAHTLPIDSSEFDSATGSTILAIAKSLESLILNGQTNQATQTAAVDSRISSCTGVTGSNLGSFGGRYSDNATIKQVLQESEQENTNSQNDRAAIRSEQTAANGNLQTLINNEVTARQAAILSESVARQSADSAASSGRALLASAISSEESRATTSEIDLSSRLDTVEAGSSVSGSISKAQADAQNFASNAVNNEAVARQAAVSVVQAQVDAIADAFQYKGNVGADGRITHIDATDANHQKTFENASFESGDMYKMNVAKTFTFSDSSTLEVEVGDSLVSLTPCPAGTCGAEDFHKWDNTEANDLLREGMLDGATIEKASGLLRIVLESVGRAQLTPSVKTDIDEKVKKSGDTMTGALKVDKVVTSGGVYSGGYDFALHIKMKSIGSASLTDTQRALLVENEVYTDGSGNPLDLDYANAATISSHYKGGSSNMSVAIVGLNGEGRVLNTAAAVYSTGVYGSSIEDQLGVNAGGTFVAQNAATANLGLFAFSDTAGAANNRGAYIALSSDEIDLDAYRVARVAAPLPVQDAALIVDDFTGVKHAAYFNGKVEINGKLIVKTPVANNEAVNLGLTKSREISSSVTISANSSEVINHGLGTKKIDPVVWVNDELSTSSFDIERTSENSITIHNDTTESVSVEILIKGFYL